MKIAIIAAAAVILTGCAAMQEAAKSVEIEIDWAGIFQAVSAVWKR